MGLTKMKPFPLFLLLSLISIDALAQPTTALYFKGSALEWVTKGRTATLTPAMGYSFRVTVEDYYGGKSCPQFAEIHLFGPKDAWTIILAMPNEQPLLVPGNFINATRFSAEDSTSPRLSFSGDGRGNNDVGGKFTILEVIISDGQLVSFAADFTQYADRALAAWAYGSIRYNSSIPLNTLPSEPQPLSVACTNSDGPVAPGWFSTTCYAGGGVEPYTWSFLNLSQGFIATAVNFHGLGGMYYSGDIPKSTNHFNYTVTVTDGNNNTASQTYSRTITSGCVPGGVSEVRSIAYLPDDHLEYYPKAFYSNPSGGSIGVLDVSFKSKGCFWSVTADIPGIMFSPASGTTTGESHVTVFIDAARNTSDIPLAGNIFLSENGSVIRTYSIVVNSSSCSYTVDPSSAQFGRQGGSGIFAVTSSPGSCHPFENAGYHWRNDADSGLYYFQISPNAGPSREGIFQFGQGIEGQSSAAFTWRQQAGDGSLLMNCYKQDPSTIDSTIATCTVDGGTPPYSWSIIDGLVPGGGIGQDGSIGWGQGIALDGRSVTLGHPERLGPYAFTVKVKDSTSVAATQTVTGTVLPTPLHFHCSVTTGPTQAGTIYSTICMPIGGTSPYKWSVAAGELPAGLTLTSIDSGEAVISGIPSTTGDYSYSIQLNDGTDPIPISKTQIFNGTIVQSNGTPILFTVSCTATSGDFKLGFPMQPIGCSVSGGTPPYTWLIHTGELPPGMVLSETSGFAVVIGGTPSENLDGVLSSFFYSYLKVTDSSTIPQPRIILLSLGVYEPPEFNCSMPVGEIEKSYFAPCTGLASDSWISSGQLPPGLAFSSNGISGIPTASGVYTFSISEQVGVYPPPSHSYRITIGPVPEAITITTNPVGRSFMVDGATYISPETFFWMVGSNHTISAITPQLSDDTRYVFTKWCDDGAADHSITISSASKTYTASFTPQYLLSVSASPASAGTVIVSPASADKFYGEGEVELTAIANSGFVFSNWSGDWVDHWNPLTIIMSMPVNLTANFAPLVSSSDLKVPSGGAVFSTTPGNDPTAHVGYAALTVNSGNAPYGTAVFSFKQNGITVSEAGVPASPPTTRARIFVDYRSEVIAVPGRSDSGIIDINTGIAIVNNGSVVASITYRLRNLDGEILSIGHGTMAAGSHFSCFIDQLTQRAAPDFQLPLDFPDSIRFGTLEIASDRPVSVLAMRGIVNQRNEFLLTSTPVADLTQAVNYGSIYFPQLVDGGGYTTSIVLLNTTEKIETGTLQIFDNNGAPLNINTTGSSRDSSFNYSIAPGGAFRLQTDGSTESSNVGWVRLIPDSSSPTPIGSGVFSYNPESILVSEAGIPAVIATTHARIYLDTFEDHNTGLAIVNANDTAASITIKAYFKDGTSPMSVIAPLQLAAKGHDARFASSLGLDTGLTGVLDISSTTPFAALTLRSLTNQRYDFIMTTFPVADLNQPAPSPIVFPQIGEGGGYSTQFILLGSGGPADIMLNSYDETGKPLPVVESGGSDWDNFL
jgi:hypothetical protein